VDREETQAITTEDAITQGMFWWIFTSWYLWFLSGGITTICSLVLACDPPGRVVLVFTFINVIGNAINCAAGYCSWVEAKRARREAA